MKNKAILYPILILLISLVIYLVLPQSESQVDQISEESFVLSTNFDYLPSLANGQLVKHQYYSLSYSEKHEQALWVAYELKKEHLVKINRKRPYFIQDKKIESRSADFRNYKKSGFSKGHLCPAGDRKFSKKAYDETFLTSNISPQKYAFNAGVWNRLEQKVRYWAGKERHLYVITGGVLTEEDKSIGSEKVSIPSSYFKILLDYSEPQIKAIAFLMPHQDSKKPLYKFVVSIDSIEKLTGIDFFPALEDALETSLEKSSDYKNWSF